MKVTRQELNNFGLFEKLPEALKNLGEREFFVFYYHVIEEKAQLYIHDFELILFQIYIHQTISEGLFHISIMVVYKRLCRCMIWSMIQ